MQSLAEAVATTAVRPAADATAILVRAALESLARAVESGETEQDNLVFVAHMLEAAEMVASTRKPAVLALRLDDDVRAYAAIHVDCVDLDVRNVSTGEGPAPAIRFITIGGSVRKIQPDSPRVPLPNLQFLEGETAVAMHAWRHQKALPEGVVSLAAWRARK